jgi:hypothetical protein
VFYRCEGICNGIAVHSRLGKRTNSPPPTLNTRRAAKRHSLVMQPGGKIASLHLYCHQPSFGCITNDCLGKKKFFFHFGLLKVKWILG